MYYEYGISDFERAGTVFAAGIGLFGVLLLFILIIWLVLYVFESIAFYTLAKRRGIQYPGLAWVPVANMWIIGSLADDYMHVTELRKTKSRYLLLSLEIVSAVISILATVMSLGFVLEMIREIFNEQSYVTEGYLLGSLSLLGMSCILWVLMIVRSVFLYIALYRIFKSCQPGNAVLYLLLAIFVSVSLPFILFAIRNKDEGMFQAYVNPPYGEDS